MNKYQEALNRIKTAPSFIGGTDLYKTHLNSSELFLQDIATLQELVDKTKRVKPIQRERGKICPICFNNDIKIFVYGKYCDECGQKLEWNDNEN